MALPNQLEEKLIVQLRNSCRDVLKDEATECAEGDMYFVRYIRANNFDLKCAELHIRESRRWRRLHKVNKILDGGLDTFFKVNYPLHLGFTDRRNRPVVVLPLGSWNLKTAVRSGLSSRFTTFTIQCMEAVMKEVASQDELRKPCAMPITQFTVVVDFHGFHFAQILDFRVLRRIHKMLSMLKSNYPETLAKCICLNSPGPGAGVVAAKFVEGLIMASFGMSKREISEKVFWLNEDNEMWKFMKEDEAKRCLDLLDILNSSKMQSIQSIEKKIYFKLK